MQCLQKNEESSGKTHSDYLLKMWAMFASLFIDPNIECFFLNAWIGMITRSVLCIKT